MKTSSAQHIAAWCLVLLCGGIIVLLGFIARDQKHSPSDRKEVNVATSDNSQTKTAEETKHLTTPPEVKALYMSSWVGGTTPMRSRILEILDTTDLNAIVIDIKDATGRIAFETNDPLIDELGSTERRIRDIEPLIQSLHKNNIYVIGRISVFQDAYLTEKKPEWALKRMSNNAVWKDKKGLSFLDPTSKEVTTYIEHIAIAAYDIGFDEINFDYIRFPSDGVISDIAYPEDGRTRADIIRDFWAILRTNLREARPDIIMSGDIFGLTTSQTNDMGIGQIIENAFPYFDAVAPMIYPSHYPSGWNGFKNPAEHPYEVIKQAMTDGIRRAEAAGYDATIFRPWIQDFDLGANYTEEMIRMQIKALRELGITSYMAWDPKNIYTPAAYINP